MNTDSAAHANYHDRRARLAAHMGSHGIALIPTAPAQPGRRLFVPL